MRCDIRLWINRDFKREPQQFTGSRAIRATSCHSSASVDNRRSNMILGTHEARLESRTLIAFHNNRDITGIG